MQMITRMTEIPTNSHLASLRLWQLISPTLPIGAYAYSQGLEYAIDAGWVENEYDTLNWLGGILNHTLARLDLPLLQRLYHAWHDNNINDVVYWNQHLLASRESTELLAEDQHLGEALRVILAGLDVIQANEWNRTHNPAYATMFALGARYWDIPLHDAMRGYCWAWCENQVAAAIKLIPLGQSAGQRILSELMSSIVDATTLATQLNDDEIGASTPGLAIASALHETQYSRLFRS